MEVSRTISGFSSTTPRSLSSTVVRRLALVACFALLYIFSLRVYPDGMYDARAMWSLRAKLIAGQSFAFTYQGYTHIPHPDYPPLLPLVTAMGYRVLGFDAPMPHLLHGGLFAALVYLAARRWWIGLLVGAVGLHYANMLVADVPLALLLVLVFLAHERGRFGWAGFALGLATLTKNEGLLMLVAYLVVWTVWYRHLPFAAVRGAVLPLLALAAFKLWVGQPNDVINDGGILERLTDFSRYQTLLSLIPLYTVRFGVGALLVVPLLLWRDRIRPRSTPLLLTIGLIWVGYLGVYLITPLDLSYHIGTSYDRLLFQLFPALVVALVPPAKISRADP